MHFNAKMASTLKEVGESKIASSKGLKKQLEKIEGKIIKRAENGYDSYAYNFPLFMSEPSREVLFQRLELYGYKVGYARNFCGGGTYINYNTIVIKW